MASEKATPGPCINPQASEAGFKVAFCPHCTGDLSKPPLTHLETELLAALKALLFNCQHGNGAAAWERDKDKARAAIAKAEAAQ